jgi:hypothetical protein
MMGIGIIGSLLRTELKRVQLASSRIWTCLQCLSNCRCMVFIAAAMFLANPGRQL